MASKQIFQISPGASRWQFVGTNFWQPLIPPALPEKLSRGTFTIWIQKVAVNGNWPAEWIGSQSLSPRRPLDDEILAVSWKLPWQLNCVSYIEIAVNSKYYLIAKLHSLKTERLCGHRRKMSAMQVADSKCWTLSLIKQRWLKSEKPEPIEKIEALLKARYQIFETDPLNIADPLRYQRAETCLNSSLQYVCRIKDSVRKFINAILKGR